MIKIFSVSQIRKADSYTIANEFIASIDLMERASIACVKQLKEMSFTNTHEYFIFCGPGNNGGDGAAIARLLSNEGFNVKIYIPDEIENISGDLYINIERLKEINLLPEKLQDINFKNITPDSILIDALFGSGLSKPLIGIYKDIVKQMNALPNIKIAIDIPSGLYADKAPDEKDWVAMQADYTFSFQFPKLAFLFPENEFYIGNLKVLPIGLSEDFIKSESCSHYLLQHQDIKQLYKPRHRFAHKGTFGHALLFGGSKGKAGAAVLMSKACIRSGAGLVTTVVPSGNLAILQTSVPEAMAIADSESDFLTTLPELSPYNSIAFGPGCGNCKETAQLLKHLIQESNVPLILDAEAINILAENPTWLAFLPQGSILTPHPGEFNRLCGNTNNSFERLEVLKAFCKRHNLFVILKGAFTVICTPLGNCYFNPTGNPGMATAGSGDTLTGILAGLLASKYTPVETCLLGVYLHGFAGDFAAAKIGFEALTASDIIDSLGEAFLDISE